MVNGLALHCPIKRSVKKPCNNSEKVAAGFMLFLSPPAPIEAWPVSTARERRKDTNRSRAHERDPSRWPIQADALQRRHRIDTSSTACGWQSNAADHGHAVRAGHLVCAIQFGRRLKGTNG